MERIPLTAGVIVDDLVGPHTPQLSGLVRDARPDSGGVMSSSTRKWILTDLGLQRLAELESKPGVKEIIDGFERRK